MKTADHSSVMCPYSLSDSAWLASAKYANVTRPVTPIPADRIAAPRPYVARVAREPVVSEPDKHHGPGERRACLLDRPVARQQRHEPPLRPVVHVAGGVAQPAHVRPAGDVEAAPERLA